MTREEVDELVSHIAASYDPAPPSVPNTSHPLFAVTGSLPVVPDVRKGHLVISNEATRELRQKDRLQKIDLELAAAGRSRPQSLVANYDQALRWIPCRCPEKLSAGFHRWYPGERNRCIGALRKKLEAGELIGAAEDGREMLPAAWGFIEFEAVPNVRFRWDDLFRLWPAAFLDNEFLKPTGTARPVVTSSNNSPDDKEVVIAPVTRSKLKAIAAFLQRGDRPKGKYKKSFQSPMRSISVMDEFAYRVQLEVMSDRRDRHNAEVKKRRAAKADHEKAIVKNGALQSNGLVSKLPPQTREFEVGFDAGRIRHLLLDLEKNEHPWLIEGTEIQRLLNSPGKPPPDIDNDLCEALSPDIESSCD